MTKKNESIITALLEDDKSVNKKDVKNALSILRGERIESDEDEVLTRREAAKRLRVSTVTITAWGKRGIIRRVAVHGQRKAVGYSKRSVLDFIEGKQKGAKDDNA